jgi:hypothetical protein
LMNIDYAMKKNLNTFVYLLVCAGLLVCLSSCGKKRREPVYPTHGQVFDKNNKPAVDATVIFHPVSASGSETIYPPIAKVDEKGNFALTTYEKDDGGPEGEYIITLEWRKQTGPLGSVAPSVDLLKGKYNNPKTSQLKFKIANQPDNVVPPIQLK